MKFQPDTASGVNVISRLEAGRLWIGATPFPHSVLVPWAGDAQPWDVDRLDALQVAHFERVAALAPEVVIFGSGRRLRFISPALLRPLIERRIGVETMDLGAACRTYNVLASEGRRVAAALLIEQDAPAS